MAISRGLYRSVCALTIVGFVYASNLLFPCSGVCLGFLLGTSGNISRCMAQEFDGMKQIMLNRQGFIV